jgi:accessory gene regulator protein AgrB
MTFSFVFGTIFLSQNIHIPYLNFIAFPIAFILAFNYAPADVVAKPIISKKQIKRMRTISFINIPALFILSFFVDEVWCNLLSISTLLSAFLTTPLAYKISRNKKSRGRGEGYA